MYYRLKPYNNYLVKNLKLCLIKEKKVILYFELLNFVYFVFINYKCVLELIDFKAIRVSTFNKNLLDLAEWEIKHAQVNL